MDNKELPLRKCAACNKMFPKDQLFRVVRLDGVAEIDLSYKAQGRGAYICKNKECLAIAEKRKSLSRSLKMAVSPEVISNLYMELENGSR